MWRDAFEGEEPDWFAVDGDGHVGHFATAGYEPVPLPVIERLDAARSDELWHVGTRLRALPVIGDATGHLRGRIDDWLELARRGLFGFDWRHGSGPYRRAATPSAPVVVSALPPDLQGLVGLVVWPDVRFARSRSLRPERLCRCG